MRFDLESLQVLVSVIEEGSLAAASERQHIVPSAISRRIAELESDAGTALLYRHSRGVEPTPAGSALYHHAKRMLDQLQQISSEMSEYAQGVRGHVRMHVNFSTMVQYLPGDLSSFLAANPDVKIDLEEKSSSQVLRAVEAGITDIGIGSLPEQVPGLEVRPYRVDTLVLIVSQDHPLSQAKQLRFADTLDQDYVSMPLGASISALCAQSAEHAGKRHKIRIQVTSFEGVRNMVSAGLGIGLLPKASVKPYLRTSALRMIELDEVWARRPLFIITRSYANLPVPSRLAFDHLEALAASET
jgi:DNA-binding transcriptional LysR family regulator